jgi:hypothetical protein
MAHVVEVAKAVVLFSATGWLLILLGVLAFFLMPALGTPSAEALHYSLARDAGGTLLFEDVFRCKGGPETKVRICDVVDAQGSGSATFRERVDGRCWTARKVAGGFEDGPALLPH